MYWDSSCADPVLIAACRQRLDPRSAGARAAVLVTGRRIEVYARGSMGASAVAVETLGGGGQSVGGVEATLHRLATIAVGLRSPLLGDRLILDQVARTGQRLPDPHPLKPVFAETVALARRVREEHDLVSPPGYPEIALAILGADTRLESDAVVVLGAGRLGRAVALAAAAAGRRVLVVTRTVRRAERALRGVGGLGRVVTVHDPAQVGSVLPMSWDAVVATDFDHEYLPVVAALVDSRGCRHAIDLSALPLYRGCSRRYTNLASVRAGDAIEAHNAAYASRATAARHRLDLHYGIAARPAHRAVGPDRMCLAAGWR
ncbi:hypothetical protein ACWEKT_20290 [Nocardia takedensis]|uniref:hypothetical protein n=1 Tax=Nocardia takedensis TaxID=259390 RepID=UPI0014613639|nr:hypothetical protein [Nocardia takedensis]